MSRFPLDWSLCRTFLAILRGGSLSEAARSLGVAHPTIRRHLEELEAALAGTLFTRSPTGLLPTELALQLRESAEAMESAAENLQRVASAEIGAVAGSVRISASEIVGVEVLPAILSELHRKHPGLAIEMKASNALDDLLRRDTDIAVRMTRPTQGEVTARKIGTVKVGLFAHATWLRSHGQPKSIETAIRDRSLIGYDRDPALLQALSSRGIAASRDAFSFRCDSDLGQHAALKAGLGVGVCQIPLAAQCAALQRVLPAYSHTLEIWLATHPNMRNVPRIRATLDALATGLRTYLGAAPNGTSPRPRKASV
jgi:DNA-binding transcriptional LysR family regulator